VTDANGCSANGFYSVLDKSLNLSTSITAATCGSDNGTIAVTVNGGSGNFSFVWNIPGTSNYQINLPAGLYHITVTDQVTGCEIEEQFVLPNEDGPVVTANITNATCGVDDGAIALDIPPGESYTFNWGALGTSKDVTGLGAGTYCVTVTDTRTGCFTVGCFTVGQGTLAIPAAITNTACGMSNGVIALNLGAGTWTITWSDGTTGTQTLSGLPAGVYGVTVSNSDGCTGEAVFAVTSSNGPDLAGSIISTSPCAGGNSASIDLVVSGGTAPYTYLWSDGSVQQDRTGLPAGPYVVQVTDAQGCRSFKVFNVTEPEPMMVVVVTSPDCELLAPQGVIHLTVTGGTQPYAFQPSEPPIQNLRLGSYHVAVVDAQGCALEATAEVKNDAGNPECLEADIRIPQVLTPNGDFNMDEWNIENIHRYPNNEVMVFNRWGDMVYQSSPYNNEWIGQYMTTGRDLPDGTYYYIVKLNDDTNRTFKGFVVIHR